MCEQVTLYLDTTDHRFAKWLREHISRSLPPPYETEDGVRIYLESAGAPYRDGFSNRIDMGATASSRAGSVPMGTSISFRYIEYKPGTIEVVAQCHLLEAASYFERLLADIAELWPEAPARTPRGPGTAEGEEPVSEPPVETSRYPHMREREKLIEQLWHEGLMIWQVAQKANCSESTVYRCLKKLGLRRRIKP